MVFSSNIFLFAYLPLFLAGYYLTPKPWRSLTIVIGSWLFYAWWRVDFLLLYAGVTLWSYWIGQRIGIAEQAAGGLSAKRWVQIGVAGSLAVLAYFKYYNFFGPEIAHLIGVDQADHWLFFKVILPIGVSFFVFESISYMVDVYRKDAPPARNFIDFRGVPGAVPASHRRAGDEVQGSRGADRRPQPYHREVLRRHGHLHDRLLQEGADCRQRRPARR